MTSVLGRRHVSDTGKTVKYTPCAKGDQTDEEELEEIAVVSRDDPTPTPTHRRAIDPSDPLQARTANGPRLIPGSGLLQHQGHSDRTQLIGEQLSAPSSGRISISSPIYSGRVVEQRTRTASRHSLFELVTSRLDRKARKSRAFSKEEVAYINKAHVSDAMTPKEIRKARRKEIEAKFGRKATQAQKLERMVESSTTSSDKDGCRWTFVFDPSGRLAYWWSFIVSIAFLYNFWVIIYRFTFEEINGNNMAIWFTLDYFADLLYILDIAFHFRTGYLEDGVLQTDGTKLRIHYMNSTMFYIDCLCLLPLDFLYLSIGFKSMLRCFRLVKIYRYWAFLDRTERHTNYPNVVRTITLLHYLFAIYHWNACLIHLVTKNLVNKNWLEQENLDEWKSPEERDTLEKYLHALYWSTLTLTTIGDLPRPQSKGEYVFVITEFVFGLLLFSTILGHVAMIVTSISTARKDFQTKLDSVKTYMSLRRVPLRLQDRVIKWFDYLWLSKKSSDEEKTLSLLPNKLKAEIALHVHLDTLKRVEIFQNTEAGFLCELVLKLRPVLFSPSDYICRKGEVGKDMYIVNRGRLQVVADNGRTVLATLRPGSYFGEISILNMGNAGNRRTASVRSVGYSDLFCLSKDDLWDVLKDYPTARVRLEAIAVKRLEKYKKAPLEKAVLPRSKSSPGLVESTGKIHLKDMKLNAIPTRHFTIPTSSLTPRGSHSGSHCSHVSYQRGLDEDCSISEHHPLSLHSGEGPSGSGELGLTHQSADITNSMTVSSITSYVTDTSIQKSPVGMIDPPPRPSSSPPISSPPSTGGAGSMQASAGGSPPVMVGHPEQQRMRMDSFSSTNKPSASAMPQGNHFFGASTAPNTSDNTAIVTIVPPNKSPPHGPSSRCAPHAAFAASDKAGLVPFSAAFTEPSATFPSSKGTTYLRQTTAGPLASSQSYPYVPAMSMVPTGSANSLPIHDSSDLLVQEISRLRERLQTLESENACMSQKLNQQQTEVEHRLAEIEMHICGSDSGSCEEERVGNKESVI